jgi:hypothetical protein
MIGAVAVFGAALRRIVSRPVARSRSIKRDS